MSDFLSADINDYCFIDTETLSGVDLKTGGLYAYGDSPDFRVMIVTYAIGDGDVQIWYQSTAHDGDFLNWTKAPSDLAAFVGRVVEGSAKFVAWNAGFDRQAMRDGMQCYAEAEVEHFLCAMVQATRSHLPPDLASAGRTINAPIQKRPDGKRLIQLFCVPPFADPANHPEEWEAFKAYAIDDIAPMRTVWQATMPLSVMEWEQYWASEKINDIGMPVDVEFAEAASELAEENSRRANADIVRLTGGALFSVNQHLALCDWVVARIGHISAAKDILLREVVEEQEEEGDGVVRLEKYSLERQRVEDLIAYLLRLDGEEGLTDEEFLVLQVLEVRAYGASATPKKFTKLVPMVSAGDRLRGQYVFAGASATGRFSSRGLQIHNLTRATVSPLKKSNLPPQEIELDAIDLVMDPALTLDAKMGELQEVYGPVGRTLSRLIRPVFVAPEGQKMIWSDWSAIEARVLPWLGEAFGGGEVLDIFRDNDDDPSLPDIYKRQAGLILIKKGEDVTKAERNAYGKVPVLSLGFGGGVGALFAMSRNYGVAFTEGEAKDIVSVWRATNPWALAYWDATWSAVIWCMQNPNQAVAVGSRLTYIYLPDYMRGTVVCMLPDGRPLLYPSIKWESRERKDKLTGKITVKDQLTYRRGYGRSALWYGTFCLGADTLVLAQRGWVPIVDVSRGDLLWDGVEWVAHGGLVYQGDKETLSLDGIYMTPDHEVLTDDGWKQAGACDGLNRAAVRMPDGYKASSEGGPKGPVCPSGGVVDPALRLRVGDGRRRGGSRRGAEGECGSVRKEGHFGGPFDARDVEAPSLRGVAQHERPLPFTFAPCMAQLRRAWDHGLRGVGSVLRGVLGGYGADLCGWFANRAGGQRSGILPNQLHMGYGRTAGGQSSDQPRRRLPSGVGSVGGEGSDPTVSVEQEPVYDISDCGPRSRFVVLGASGPLIVHNCENAVQGVAGSLLRHSLERLTREQPQLVVGHTHDEIIACAPLQDVAAGREALEHAMLDLPDWAEGLPMACEVSESFYYTKTID